MIKAESRVDAPEKLVRISPAWLRKQYGLTDADVGKGAASNNTQAVASFIKQFYAKADMTAFWAKYVPSTVTPYTDVPSLASHTRCTMRSTCRGRGSPSGAACRGAARCRRPCSACGTASGCAASGRRACSRGRVAAS